MALFRLLVVILAAIGLAQANQARVLPGAFIVEYEDEVDIDSHLSSVQHLASTRLKLDHKLFKGASIRFHDTDEAQHHAELLASTPHVKNIWPVYLYDIPEYTIHSNAGETQAMAAPDVSTARQAPPDTFSPHVMTQVSRLRDEGVTGEGIKIAVVDTGIDYRHPALGGCFGPGCLVSSGYDFVGDAFNGTNTPVPGPDPPLDCGGHGTHVAGIIAAQEGGPYGVIGAATGVTLSAYRVFGCDGHTTNDVLIAAFNKAYEDGADIITASIGEASGWKEDPWSVMVSQIVEKGVPCTLAAGNFGEDGVFDTSAAANGKRVTAIASVDNNITPELFTNASYTVEGGLNESFGYMPGMPDAWLNVTLPLRAVSFNITDSAVACSPLSSQSPDLSGYVVLVRRGACSFDQKLRNLVAKGAHHVLFYNNQSTGAVDVSASSIPGLQAVGMVAAEQGARWTAKLSSSENITVALADPSTSTSFLVGTANNETGGYMSTYTSWGPTYEVDFKPQFAAPGGRILSTYLTKSGSYKVMSGTSMAAPLVAAIYALLMTARGTKDPQILESLISSTSRPLRFNDGKTTFPVLAPTVQQGSGMVQAYDAAYATSLLSVSRLSFNDTDNIRPVQHFTISNNGSESVLYTLGHAGAATAYTLPSHGSIYPAKFPAELHDDYATVKFSDQRSFTLSAGQRKVVSVTATPPAGLDARRLPVYSGYITINGSDGSGLSLPYIGVAGSLYSATVLDTAKTFVAKSPGPSTSISANHTFILPPPGHTNDPLYTSNLTNVPMISVGLAWGSALLRIDVVPVSVPSGTNVSVSLGLRTLGDVLGTPTKYDKRGLKRRTWGGALSNGQQVPAGTYKLVIRALKIFGDRDKADDYETVETPEFSIRYMDLQRMPSGPRRQQRGWNRDHVRNA